MKSPRQKALRRLPTKPLVLLFIVIHERRVSYLVSKYKNTVSEQTTRMLSVVRSRARKECLHPEAITVLKGGITLYKFVQHDSLSCASIYRTPNPVSCLTNSSTHKRELPPYLLSSLLRSTASPRISNYVYNASPRYRFARLSRHNHDRDGLAGLPEHVSPKHSDRYELPLRSPSPKSLKGNLIVHHILLDAACDRIAAKSHRGSSVLHVNSLIS